MEVQLEVLLSSSIKRKKPWPGFCWLGQEKESVFLLDEKRISEVNLVSGRTKKKIPKLHPLLRNVVIMSSSRNGAWLVGLLNSGEIFLWNKDKDCLKTVAAAPDVSQTVTASLESSVRLKVLVSGDGKRVVLTTLTGRTFLWESTEARDMTAVKDPAVRGRWAQILQEEDVSLPTQGDKETTMHSIFIQDETVGDCCLCSFVFTVEEKLSVTILKIEWGDHVERHLSQVPYSVKWVTQTYPMAKLTPQCRPVKSRGALVSAISGDGLVLAIAVNQRDPKATQVLFVSTLNFITVCSSLKGCGSKELQIPAKYVRSYWVGSVSWTPDSLYLACVLKRGALLLVTRLGPLLTLCTSGCSVEFGPAEFIPLHPLITYRPPASFLASQDPQHSASSCASARDLMRQRFSVTSHPRLQYLIVSDGYMATVLRFASLSSPSSLMSSLLMDTARRLELIRQGLARTQPQQRSWLQSMSSLKMCSLQDLQLRESSLVTTPHFLLDTDEMRDVYEKTTDYQNDEDESDEGSLFPSQSVVDGGRLEFASMFDTIHAKPESPAGPIGNWLAELEQVQRNLLRVWTLGVSLGRVTEKERLLRCMVHCFGRFARLLQLAGCPLPAHLANAHDRDLRKVLKKEPWVYRLLWLLQGFLTLLSWDAPHRGCLGLAVELTRQVVGLLLPHPVSSQALSGTLLVLRLASHSLNVIYRPQRRAHLLPLQPGELTPSDSFSVQLLQQEGELWEFLALSPAAPQVVHIGGRPSDRLTGLWKAVYRKALVYQTDLRSQAGFGGDAILQHEEDRVSQLIAQVQVALQSAGQGLTGSRKLQSIAGEQHFLLGSYTECLQLWRAAVWEARAKGSARTCFLETRYYLALLYCHLFQYNLSAAQGLCDHLVRQVLRQAQLYSGDSTDVTVEECRLSPAWLPVEVNSEAASAVIQSMGRFMAAYFTNEPLAILPPHHVDILPPLHIRPDHLPRLIPLQHSAVAGVVREQQLSLVWTVAYTLDLLLIGGLLPEAAWLAHRLGDWKMAVSLGLGYTLYCRKHFTLSELQWRELHLPDELQPKQIFQEQLQSLLWRQSGPEKSDPGTANKVYKHFTDSIEEEDADLLLASVQEILKAAVMADADVLSQTFHGLMESAKDQASKLSGLVPLRLYLPAPPLYCPQPSSDPEDVPRDVALVSETVSRQHVSGVLQRVLLLLRAAHCSLPAAQWYIHSLKRCRRIISKIHTKTSQAPLNPFPEALLKYAVQGRFFNQGRSADQGEDPVVTQTITSFRELCGLCWMFHVREQLSVTCRRYQRARSNVRDLQAREGAAQYDSAVVEHCLEALEWACRLLPFTRFMNAEEIVQDIILSLVAELPPIKKVAEVLARVFPKEEDSVRVPLREKYSSLLQRLRPYYVTGPETGEEMMTVVIQDLLRLRGKQLRGVARYIGPVELHLWERAEEGPGENNTPLYDHLSLGTSLSRSTLTDCGRPQFYSDGDTADTISYPLSPDHGCDTEKDTQCKPVSGKGKTEALKPSDKQCKDQARGVRKDGEAQERLSLPVVGTWEFEREDEEYICFLELFLSYVLEKDQTDKEQPGVPLLSCFSQLLKEKELNSLLFDVHTTLKRRQRKEGGSVFRAGSCYQLLPEPTVSMGQAASVHSETLRPSALRSSTHYFPSVQKPKQGGLFGLKQQGGLPEKQSSLSQAPSETGSFTPHLPKTESWLFKAVSPNQDPSEELSPQLQPRFQLLGRLLEWMIRWSDRRLLCAPAKAPRLPEYGPVIRVKATAPAVLTALHLLERRYLAGLSGEKTAQIQVLERESPVAPVVQLEMGWKAERESSVDTGYPGSAGTPITLHDQEPEHSHVSDSMSEGPHQGGEMDRGQRACRLYDVEDLISESESKEDGNPPDDELALPSDQEGHSSPDESWEPPVPVLATPSISVHIQPLHRSGSTLHDRTLKLSDLECPRSDPTTEEQKPITASRIEEAHSQDSPSMPSSVTTGLEAEMEASMAVSNEEGSKKDSAVQTNPLSNLPLGPQPGPAVTAFPRTEQQTGSRPDAQPPPQSDAVRQMLQDEMFRLVQLQQINFMSLMQVVGASFMNLPNLQQNLQPNMLANPPSLVPGAQPSQHQTGLSGLQSGIQHRDGGPSNQQAPSTERHAKSMRTDQSNKENIAQNFSDLNLHLDSQGSQAESEGFIPASRGLLTTARDNKLQLLLLPSTRETPALIPLQKTAAPAAGWKLLQLRPPELIQPHGPPAGKLFSPLQHGSARPPPPPPPPREAWAPQREQPPRMGRLFAAPPHLNISRYNTDALRRAEEEQVRWAEKVAEGPPKHLNLGRYTGHSSATPQAQTPLIPRPEPQPYQPERPTEASMPEAACSVPLQSCRLPQLHGLPLLRFHPQPRSCLFPHILPAAHVAPGRPSPSVSGDPARRSSMQLLHLERDSLGKVFPQTAPLQPPGLIPLEQLAAFSYRQQPPTPGEDPLGQLRLLRADPEPTSKESGRDSLKRQKRRNEKMQESQKAGVTFRPVDSIIQLEEFQPRAAEPSTSPLGEGFVLPPGSFDSVLSGRDVTTGPLSTPAELHLFAATKKKPAEIQDASTNTDPDKGASERFIVQRTDSPVAREVPVVLPPDVFLNLRFPEESTEGTSAPDCEEPATDTDVASRRFINVIDIEDGDLLRGLSASPECRALPPTTSQLHLMAASVTNAVPPDYFLKESEAGRHQARLEDPPLETQPSWLQPAGPVAEPPGDELTYRLLMQSGPTGHGTRPLPASRSGAKSHVATKLSEMDVQLAALQSIADNMEREFANTKMLVKTIDSLSTAVGSELESNRYTSRAVAVTEEVRFLRYAAELEDVMEEEDVPEPPPAALAWPVLWGRSLSPPSSASLHQAASADFDTMADETGRFPEDTLGLSGLSDVADILGELVRDGGVSATDLGLSTTQAVKLSRLGEQQLRRPGQKTRRSEEERREVREWMRRKRRDRLAEYRRQREERREREHRPFKPATPSNPTSRDISINQKIKEEKDKMLQLEHHSQRTREALSLMTEMLSDPVPRPSLAQTTLRSGRRGRVSSRCQSAGRTGRSPSRAGHARSLSSPGRTSQLTDVQIRQPAARASAASRLGIHRPARALPRDQMSQVTRRGMLVDLGSRRGGPMPRETAGAGRGQRPSGSRSVVERSETWAEREVVSPWSPPAEVRRLLDMEDVPSLQGLSEDGSPFRRADLEALDGLSESTGSVLSKLDWVAIERMVASEGGV
ncbi:ciliogenesis and planar polarity effector 1 [Amia ocellicauda]|uniref:ciliogenesis and planar polarity effector 1 n=1 Tax=Amia ocellicauda TaxID=2972642 RepID=UPI003463F279